MIKKKILVIAGGGKKHLQVFENKGKELGLNVTTASFSDLNYENSGKADLMVCEEPFKSFSLIYIRLVGKRFEDLALLINEAKKFKIPVIDRAFTDSGLARLPVSKVLEAKLLSESGLPIPKTVFDRLSYLSTKAPEVFGYPFVLKSTTGKQGHEVWSPRNEAELTEIIEKLRVEEKKGKRFLAQEFVEAPKRIRVLVVGNRVIGAIQRPTRWRKRFSQEIVEKTALNPISKEISELAVKAAKTLMLDIAGVDILEEKGSGKLYVLEVNSAPRWEAIARDCGINVEAEILKFFQNKQSLF